LADEAGSLELALALEQSAVLLPSRRSAAVPGVPGIGREWAPVARHVRCRPPSHVELARGIEPPTCGLQNRCSAVELRQRPRASAMVAYFTTGNTTSPVSLRGAQRRSNLVAALEQRDGIASLRSQ